MDLDINPIRSQVLKFHSKFSSLLCCLTTNMASLAGVGSEFCIALDFNVNKLGPDFMWFNPPSEYHTRQNGSSGIKVVPVSTHKCKKYI
jgi:hypothetical protein